tara:strand:+ start:4683 stop:4976 length:294 start_codon:yes stop_codon:yes gene_type:complete
LADYKTTDLKQVFVRWIDSTTECNTAWNNREEVTKECESLTDKDLLCKTAGFLLLDKDEYIVVTMNYHETEIGPYLIIPRCCILEMKTFDTEEEEWE